MKYTTEKINDNNVRFRFTVPAAEFESAVDAVYFEKKNSFEIPGIRKGKAGRKMLENYFGRDFFIKQALDKTVTNAYGKAASEYPEEIYYIPVISVEQNEPGRDLVFSARVKINPESKLCDYRSVVLTDEDTEKVEETVRSVSEKDRESTRLYLLQSALIGRIAEKSTIEIPETMINERAMSMAREFQRRLEMNQDSLENYYKETGTDEKAMLRDFADAAEKQLRSRLTLLAIAHEEGLEATENEYDAEIQRLSAMYPMPPEEIKKHFIFREGSKLKQDIAISKAADFTAGLVRRQIRSGRA